MVDPFLMEMLARMGLGVGGMPKIHDQCEPDVPRAEEREVLQFSMKDAPMFLETVTKHDGFSHRERRLGRNASSLSKRLRTLESATNYQKQSNIHPLGSSYLKTLEYTTNIYDLPATSLD